MQKTKYFIVLILFFSCNGDYDELFEKIQSQAMGFFFFATHNEDDYHDCMHKEVSYHLYTSEENESFEIFEDDFTTLQQSPFDTNKKTVMVIHGYTDNKDRKIIIQLRKALLNNIDANVMVVDWHKAANQIYFTAVTNSLYVGRQVGQFLIFLESYGYDLNNVHIIGHSLGAQIAGVAGERVNGKLGRISGLDPAGPYFDYLTIQNSSASLDPSDAKFVDVIHSAIGTFGVTWPIGHVDFYPNYGEVPQPGCTNAFLAVSCSHVRSVLFYVESINTTKKFLGKKCLNWHKRTIIDCLHNELEPMGYFTPESARGNYYLQTNEEPPFAMGTKFFKRPPVL